MKSNFNDYTNTKLGIVGLGYVGLPLAVEFSKHFKVTGFDIDNERISELIRGFDRTNELSSNQMSQLSELSLTGVPEELKECDVYIVTVPTPVDTFKVPDLTALKNASSMIGKLISNNNLIIYESTVYPGVTENICAPIIEHMSGLKYNVDFFLGYSPERINPGDKKHTIDKVIKLVSGSNEQATDKVKFLYNKIAHAGLFVTKSIQIAEAAKVIENIQRDVNIALINELSKIFDSLRLPINEILEAASTKWNFLNFKPGLVGGHCIGVDPYYLMHICNLIGEHPELISAARRINDYMPEYWATQFIKKFQENGYKTNNKILILGATFKENCPDIRNTKVFEFSDKIEIYGYKTEIYDPIADVPKDHKYFDKFTTKLKRKGYDGVILLVAHEEFINLGAQRLQELCTEGGIFYDMKMCV